jgi:phosphoribosylcarboxyaminoimidazole (NCAIR) mutase
MTQPDRYMILGCGSTSDLKHLKPEYERLGSTINDFLESKGTFRLADPAVTSVHRDEIPGEAGMTQYIEYAKQIVAFAKEKQTQGNRVGILWFGGRAFALPGVQAALMSEIPTISVPVGSDSIVGGGIDSLLSVANIPEGTAVGCTGVHTKKDPTLDKGVAILNDLLGYDGEGVHLFAPRYSDGTDRFRKMDGILTHLFASARGLPYSKGNHMAGPAQTALGLYVISQGEFVTDLHFKKDISRSDVALLTCTPTTEETRFGDIEDVYTMTQRFPNTLYFGEPGNAALFTAQVLGQKYESVREAVVNHFKDHKAGKRVDTQVIDDDAFVR